LLASLAVAGAVAAASATSSPDQAPDTEIGRWDRSFYLQADAVQEPGARRALPMPRPLPPVETLIVEDSEFTKKRARKAWFAERHRTAPGTDWKALERANGRAQLIKRNALARGAAPPPAFSGTWQERGSDNQAGRSHSAAFSSDGSALYIGSALGGVWRGSPEGTDWEPLGDDLYGGAHQLVVLPGDTVDEPDILLAAARWSWLHFSEDDGETWQEPEGLPARWLIVRLTASSEADPAVWTIIDNGYGATLSRSTDGGRSFETVRELGAPGAGAGSWDDDVWLPRDGDGTVYIVADGVLEVSEDGGDTWQVRSAPDPEAAADGRIQAVRLVGSEAGAPTLYAAVTTGAGAALHRSADAGWTWEEVEPEMSDFWGAIEASMVDDNLVVWGGIEAHRSTDGGRSTRIVNAWGEYYGDPATFLHADIMGLDAWPDPADPSQELWFANTDGGTYISEDGLETVDNLSLQGLRISQYYDVLTSTANPAHVAAGSQDQGYQVTQGLEQDDPVLQFAQIYSGDYGHLSSSDGSHSVVYSVYPGFLQVRVGEESPALEWGEFPAGATHGWLPMVVADPEDPEAVFFTADHLYRYTRGDRGTWEPERWSEHDFAALPGEYMSALAFAPSDPDLAYAVTTTGRLLQSTDRGRSWTEAATGLPGPHYFYGTALVVDALRPDHAWAGGSGYDNAPVVRTVDGGQTWEPWSEGLPPTLVYTLVQLRDGSGTIVAGTETGAWARGPEDAEWIDITGSEAPVTTYWGAEVLAHENTVRFATYGRGLWDWQLPPPEHCYPVVDGDSDGVGCDLDCDDDDGERSPGRAEVCGDGIDQDCDGEDQPCTDEAGTDDTDPGGAASSTESGSKGSGCGHAPATGGLLLGLIALMGRRRRNRA
jgi:hypothetical protein